MNTRNPYAHAPGVAGIFFPQRPLLRLDNHAYSPRILHKIVATAGLVKSFALAAQLLELNAEFAISGRHVNRLTQEIGVELQQARDQRTQDYVHHRRVPVTPPPAAAVAVGLDGGRINTRAPDCGPGVHAPGWREDKVACLHVLAGAAFDADPHPQPPRCFVDKDYVKDLVKEFQQHKGLRDVDEPEPDPGALAPDAPLPALPAGDATPLASEDAPPAVAATGAAAPQADACRETPWPPRRTARTCVSSLACSRDFAKMVAAEVYARGFAQVAERAFLGDGLAYNWKIQESWLPDFTPILDFIHPLSYLYAAAGVLSADEGQRWSRYVRWLTATWQGRVSEVLTELRAAQADCYRPPGEPAGKLPANDPREVVRRTLGYLTHNASRMDYPQYRQRGLPVTSAAVESLIKEFNYRVKGSERFWNRPAEAEAILQVRAAVLSEDGRLEYHLVHRPGQAHRRKYANTGRDREAA